ncbi:MAG: tetratricopeptide repeat protein [Planctomycetota bacterium]
MARPGWRRPLQLALPFAVLALVAIAVPLADVAEQLAVGAVLAGLIAGWLLVPLVVRLRRRLKRRHIIKQRLPDLPAAARHDLAAVFHAFDTDRSRDLLHAAAILRQLQNQIEHPAPVVTPSGSAIVAGNLPVTTAAAAAVPPPAADTAAAALAAAPAPALATVPDLPAVIAGLQGICVVRAMLNHHDGLGLFDPHCPEIERQMFCRGVPALSKRALVDELTTLPLRELDRLARRLIATLDLLVESTAVPHLIPAADAVQMLTAMVGRAPLRAHGDSWIEWWRVSRPRLLRTGGAGIVAMRLLRDRRHNQVYQLGQRMWAEGVPSADFQTLLDVAGFFRFVLRPRSTIEDTADRGRAACPYFAEGRYWNIADFLKYPLGDATRALQFCRNYPEYRRNKIEFIDRLIELAVAYPGEMDQVLAEALFKLVGDTAHHVAGRGGWKPAMWQEFWRKLLAGGGFEPGLEALVRGVEMTEARRMREARQALEMAARQMPDATAPVINLVYLECQAGRPDHARRAIEAVLDARPTQGTLALGLGKLAFFNLHDLALAERLLTRAQKLMFEPIEAHLLLGHTCLMTNRAKLAQEHYRRAYELDPSCPDALLGLARTMIELKMYLRAIDYLKTVTLQYPGAPADWANFFLFQTYREIGQNHDAIERLRSVPEVLIDDPDLLEEISYYLESQQEYPWARDLQKRAMLYRTKNPPKENSRASGGTANPWDDPNSDPDDGGLKEGPAR